MNNPINGIDPSGYKSFIEHAFTKLRDEVGRAGKDLVGGVLIVGGIVVMALTGETGVGTWVGASMMATGANIINGENKIQAYYGMSYGNDASSPLSTEASSISSEIYYTADITYNYKYMNGAASESFATTQDNTGIEYGGDGRIIITKYFEGENSQLESALKTYDYRGFAYDVFTYTPIGGAYDIMTDYYADEIGLGAAIVLGGMNFVPGGSVAGKSLRFIHNSNINSLISTHSLTLSRRKFKNLTHDVYTNGVQKPISYVKYNGNNYIVDGHHRVQVGKNLGLNSIPSVEVGLPYRGYKSIQDLFY